MRFVYFWIHFFLGLFETSVRFHESKIIKKESVPKVILSPKKSKTNRKKKGSKKSSATPQQPEDTRTITFEPTVETVIQSLSALIANTINTFDDVSRLLRVRVQSVARRLRHIITDPMKVRYAFQKFEINWNLL